MTETQWERYGKLSRISDSKATAYFRKCEEENKTDEYKAFCIERRFCDM